MALKVLENYEVYKNGNSTKGLRGLINSTSVNAILSLGNISKSARVPKYFLGDELFVNDAISEYEEKCIKEEVANIYDFFEYICTVINSEESIGSNILEKITVLMIRLAEKFTELARRIFNVGMRLDIFEEIFGELETLCKERFSKKEHETLYNMFMEAVINNPKIDLNLGLGVVANDNF